MRKCLNIFPRRFRITLRNTTAISSLLLMFTPGHRNMTRQPLGHALKNIAAAYRFTRYHDCDGRALPQFHRAERNLDERRRQMPSWFRRALLLSRLLCRSAGMSAHVLTFLMLYIRCRIKMLKKRWISIMAIFMARYLRCDRAAWIMAGDSRAVFIDGHARHVSFITNSSRWLFLHIKMRLRMAYIIAFSTSARFYAA